MKPISATKEERIALKRLLTRCLLDIASYADSGRILAKSDPQFGRIIFSGIDITDALAQDRKDAKHWLQKVGRL